MAAVNGGAADVETSISGGGGPNVPNGYEFFEVIGSGNSVVQLCKDKLTHEYVACKSIKKPSSSYEAYAVEREIEMMNKLRTHPNIVGLKNVYHDDKHVHIIMEYCEGLDLLELLENQGLTESNAQILFKKLMEAVKFCHDRGIVHRDITPENVFLATKDRCRPDIRLGDFGLATYIKPGEKLHSTCGSAFHIAPEVLYEKPYDQAVDVWSAGVVLFELLSGTLPFDGETAQNMLRNISVGKFWLDPCLWDNISASGKDLVTRMLCKDPAKRLTATEVLNHSWMNEGVSAKGTQEAGNPPRKRKRSTGSWYPQET